MGKWRRHVNYEDKEILIFNEKNNRLSQRFFVFQAFSPKAELMEVSIGSALWMTKYYTTQSAWAVE